MKNQDDKDQDQTRAQEVWPLSDQFSLEEFSQNSLSRLKELAEEKARNSTGNLLN